MSAMTANAKDTADADLLLASASQRRKELLEQIGYRVSVAAAEFDEQSIRSEDPVELVQRLSAAKLQVVLQRLAAIDDERVTLPAIGADTVVLCRGAILEKPEDEREARSMLELLSATTHQVITGVAVQLPDRTPNRPTVAYAETHVTFAPLSDAEIEWYLATQEWEGVAGGYRIQDSAARFITGIIGSYSNVVGLPLHLVYSILSF